MQHTHRRTSYPRTSNQTKGPLALEMVIDNVQDDLIMLHGCPLVSKGWISRSRGYLFQEIALDSSVTFSRISSIVLSEESGFGPSQSGEKVLHRVFVHSK
jgi:hypothetical protein